MTTLELETPHGPARAHLHAADSPRAALVLGHVEVRLDDRDRVPELVRRVGEELLLGGEGAVDPLEHGVEGVGEALQLVRRPPERDPPREIGGGDLLRGGRDPVDGPQQPARVMCVCILKMRDEEGVGRGTESLEARNLGLENGVMGSPCVTNVSQ